MISTVVAFTIRDYTPADRPAVEALETAFTTSTIFDVEVTARGIALVERSLAEPLLKRYPIADAFAPWAMWDVGFVAEDGGVCGFAATEYAAWHTRLILWHLYVAPPRRRQGIARALLNRVEAQARTVGASRIWLETSNVNHPGILAYERLGYTLCGADVTHYESTPAAAETALFLSKPV